MKETPLRIVILGLSITSSWGNGHATTYRGLVKALSKRGHSVLFLERDQPWYAENRDLAAPPYCRTALYSSLTELRDCFSRDVAEADLVIVGSYVTEGVEAGKWVLDTAREIVAFYDIDTPVTLAKLEKNDAEYLSRELVGRYDLYLSFTGGPTLRRLETSYGSPMARVLYCSVDPDEYHPEERDPEWDLGYLGTYSQDRQPALHELLIRPAKKLKECRFVVAGPMFPASISWPSNVARIQHLPPGDHRSFYTAQRFTLNVTRRSMVLAGYSPSVRLFEAAACGTPIISDAWPGLEECFLPEKEVLVARCAEEAEAVLQRLPERDRLRLGQRLRKRILRQHTCDHRARQLEGYALELLNPSSLRSQRSPSLAYTG